MDYRNYSAKDLALDKKFQQWILAPDEEVTQFWDQWLKENPGRRSEIEKAKELIRMAGLSADADANEKFLQVWQNLRSEAQTATASKRRWSHGYTRIAAVFTVFALAGAYFYWNRQNASNIVEHRTGYGEIKKVLLADGSTVTLNANSVLTYQENWTAQTKREVSLDGEAFFEIVKTKDHKTFEVVTPRQLHIQVLGTEFNVKTRRESTAVYLHSGKVRINSPAAQATLKPGELAIYQAAVGRLEITTEGSAWAENGLAWRNNLFIFNDTPLPEVLRELEDNYGVNAIVTDAALNQKKITAKIPRKDIDVLLKVLAETLEINIEQKGDQLIISAAE